MRGPASVGDLRSYETYLVSVLLSLTCFTLTPPPTPPPSSEQVMSDLSV